MFAVYSKLSVLFYQLCRLCDQHASLPVLIGFLNGIITSLLFIENSSYLCWLWTLPVVGSFMCFWKIDTENRVRNNIHCLKVVLFTVIGIVISLNENKLDAEHYLSYVKGRDCGAVIQAVIKDVSCVGENDVGLGNPRLIQAEIHYIKYSKSDSWRKCNGYIMLKKLEAPLVKYGYVLNLEGVFLEPADYENGGFKRFLLSKGVRKIFSVRKADIVMSDPSSLIYFVSYIRNKMMNHLLTGLKQDVRSIVAALVFGCRQGLEFDLRNVFIKSGTFHVFAISGLHIGILAMFFLLVLRVFPVKLRFFLIPFLLAVYLVTIGFRVSAMRAFIMIVTWAMFKCSLYRTSNVNITFFAASAVLFLSPFALLDIGFQYSFIIVLVLVIGSEGLLKCQKSLFEKRYWVPKSNRTQLADFVYTCKSKVFSTFTFCVLAWLGSCGVTVFYNGYYTLSGVMCNMALVPMLLCLFILVPIKIIVPFISFPYIDNTINWLVELMLGVCRAGVDIGLVRYVGYIGVFGVVIYYLAFVKSVSAKSWRGLCQNVLICSSLVSFVHLYPSNTESKVVLVYGGGGQPSVMFINRFNKTAKIVNCSSNIIAEKIIVLLKQESINTIDSVYLPNSKSDVAGGMYYLTYRTYIDKVFTSGTNRTGSAGGVFTRGNDFKSQSFVKFNNYHYELLLEGMVINIEANATGVTVVDICSGLNHKLVEVAPSLGAKSIVIF